MYVYMSVCVYVYIKDRRFFKRNPREKKKNQLFTHTHFLSLQGKKADDKMPIKSMQTNKKKKNKKKTHMVHETSQ